MDEYAVKAAFLYKFGLFVEWPVSAFPSQDSPIYLCIIGADPYGRYLDTVVADAQIKGHKVVIRRLQTVGKPPPCHILYAGGSAAQNRDQIIETVRGSNVLTVSDDRVPGSKPGIINFVISDSRVRFNIDNEAAAENGLTISSELLSLALNIRRQLSKGGQ